VKSIKYFPYMFQPVVVIVGGKISTSWRVRKPLHFRSANASAKLH